VRISRAGVLRKTPVRRHLPAARRGTHREMTMPPELVLGTPFASEGYRREQAGEDTTKHKQENTMKTRTILAITAFAALSSATAFAQSSDGMPFIQNKADPASFKDASIAPNGLALQLGGGVTGFTRKGARNEFNVGGYWDVRAVMGTNSIIGAEVAYVGSARDIQSPGVSNNAAMMGNGAEAVARANLPLRLRNVQLTPYAFGGVGWTYYQIVSNDISNTSGVKDHANALVIPFGTGVSVSYQHFLADARFTYRGVFDDKLVPTGGNDHLDLQNWSAGATVGYAF
jgi:hypothetical protein